MKYQKIALPDSMFNRVKLLAARLEMTFVGLVRAAIAEYLEKHGG
jgi:predicted DNA-binding protein